MSVGNVIPSAAQRAESRDLHRWNVPTAEELRLFREDLPSWFTTRARDLPWRRTKDPYRIWLSEVMLQQTRVDQALPYYERFVAAFPDADALAAASLDDVLLLWEGLGYYSRARHLHEAAKRIIAEHDAIVPEDPKALRALPGIGPYTAAAILSIAFGKPHAVLDGNVIRVLTRVYAGGEDVRKPSTRRMLQDLADQLVPHDQPGVYNEAVMELGATVCTPHSPECGGCPLRVGCRAHIDGNPGAYPFKSKKKKTPHYDVAVGLVSDVDGRLLIQRRPEKGLLGGLWEFPGGKREGMEALEQTCRRELKEELNIDIDVEDHFHTLSHAYSHFRITLHAFRCTITDGTPEPREGQPFEWVVREELAKYAFPRANRRLIELL